jgi:signal peptidase I
MTIGAAETPPPLTTRFTSRPRRVGLALVLSLLFPGLGQIYTGQLSKALIVIAGALVLDLLAVAVGLPLTFVGLLALLFTGSLIYVALAVDAVVFARRSREGFRETKSYPIYTYFAFAIGVFVLRLATLSDVRRSYFQAYKMPSGSMEATLLIGDYIMVDKRPVAVHRNEIIVFAFPPDPLKEYVKRIIAVGGDSVVVRNGVVYLNGQQASDAHAHLDIAAEDRLAVSPRDNFGPVTVPTGKLFVLGDNRDHSYDSRFGDSSTRPKCGGVCSTCTGRTRKANRCVGTG